MTRSRYTDSQIMDALKRVEAGIAVPDLFRELGISSATFYKWRAKYGGMDTSMMDRMKELEEENRRLKTMYAEEHVKAEIIAEALAKSGEAIPATRDGQTGSQGVQHTDQVGVRRVSYQ